jgi:hypothetical protein
LFANPYYAAALIGVLLFWLWPAFLYKDLAAHWLTVVAVSAALFLGAGKLGTEAHIRFIAPRKPPRGHTHEIAIACAAIVLLAWLTRLAYDLYAGAA